MTARTVLITGASQGIGAATARVFAQAGWRVALVARDGEKLAAVTSTLGHDAASFPCDVTDPDAVAALFSDLRARFGRLDAAFNNAGANMPTTLFGEIDFALWRRVVSVNLDGAFLIADGAFRMMRDQTPQGGRIINNGSISAHAPRYGSAAYTASKHAITGLTKSIALDGRTCNVACGQIDIGNAASAMTSAMAGGVPQADGSLKAEPTMDVAVVAQAVLQMAELPLSANVLFQTIMASDMPFVGRG